jgi:hypothetical protein
VLWQETDPGSNFPRTERVTEEQSMSATRPHKPEEHFDRCALARTVRTKEAEGLSAAHMESQILHRGMAAIGLL